jgi:predicted N-acetyltransferase YhbS
MFARVEIPCAAPGEDGTRRHCASEGDLDGLVVRALRGGDEVERWSRLCALCFASKPRPPNAEYFVRHLVNDPRGEAQLVLVAAQAAPDGAPDELVASVRVFRRQLGVGNAGVAVEACGLGEVCTHPAHRGRGLASRMVAAALELASSLQPAPLVCALHCAPSLAPLYARAGFRAVPTAWTELELCRLPLAAGSASRGWRVRPAVWPADAAVLAPLHEAWTERRFAGAVVRNSAYWTRYVAGELGSEALVAELDGRVRAWGALRWQRQPQAKTGRFELREFGCELGPGVAGEVLAVLLDAALASSPEWSSSMPECGLFLRVPTAILDATDGYFASSIKSERYDPDLGWMYRGEGGRSAVEEAASAGRCAHLVWPTDSF